MLSATRHILGLAAALGLVAATLPGCILDRSGLGCTSDSSCSIGERCIGGRCVAVDDAGLDGGDRDGGADGGADAGADAGTDAGADGGADAGADAGTDAGPTFDPSAIAGLVLWLRPDGLPTGPLASWDDATGAVAATAVNTPPVVIDLGGLPAVRFDGTGHYVTDPIRWGGGSTVYLVARLTPGTTGFRLLHSDDQADHFNLLRRTGGDELAMLVAGTRGLGPAPTDGALHVYRLVDDGSTVTLTIDGVGNATVARSIPSRTRALGIGGNPVTSLSSAELEGDVAELLLWDEVLGATDRADVERYLAERWGSVP